MRNDFRNDASYEERVEQFRHEQKLRAVRLIHELGVALSLNVVLHRFNIDQLGHVIGFAESLGATVERLKGKNIADAVAAFTRDKHITQVIFGRSAVDGWRKWLYMNAMNRFLRGAPAVDIHIVTQEPD